MNNEKIIMLGTGHGFTFDLYNTCFILKNGDKNLLVDTRRWSRNNTKNRKSRSKIK